MLTYKCCEETGLLVCEIRANILVREDGLTRNISGRRNSKKDWNNGPSSTTGYRQVADGKKVELVHRLVAEAFLPKIPDKTYVDHRNGVKHDNRVENLRYVNLSENQKNRVSHREGRLLGCYLMKDKKRVKPWQAQAIVKGEKKYLGLFATEQEAHEAYVKFVKNNNL